MAVIQVLAQRFYELFAGHERSHGEYTITHTEGPKAKGKAKTVHKPATIDLWQDHLSGKKGLGIVPIRDDNTCTWAAIDIDSYDGFDVAGFSQMIERRDIPVIVCRSKSGGAHLYMFTTAPVSAKLIRDKMSHIAMAVGYHNAEIFPKQEVIHSDKDFGNWINMPYYEEVYSTRYALEDGQSVSADRFLELAKARALTPEALAELSTELPGAEEFDDAPPCLQYLVMTGFPQGSRNNALFSMGVYARKKYADGWEDKIFEYNQRFMGPGSFGEVKQILKSLGKKTYEYMCKDQPICGACNKTECENRKFGIKSGTKEDESECILDEVDRPVKVYTPPEGSNDEPQWVFKIAGRDFDVSLDMVIDQNKFLREYLKKFHRMALPVKQPKWVKLMNEILAEAEVHQLAIDAGPEGQFLIHLEAFCTGKVQARAREELILGRPWTEEDRGVMRTFFRSKDLMDYMDKRHFREFKEKQIWAILRRHGADHGTFMIKSKCVSWWSVEAFKTQTEPFDDVPVPKEAF